MIDKFKEQQAKDNKFFGIKSIYDEEILQVGTVVRQSKSLDNKSQV